MFVAEWSIDLQVIGMCLLIKLHISDIFQSLNEQIPYMTCYG